MSKEKVHKRIPRDPVTGGEMVITELTGEDSGVRVKGRFEVPRFARLDQEQTEFLETFLRCRGMLNSVERDLGISYPTVRSRLDALLDALGLVPKGDGDGGAKRDKAADRKRKILDQLEKGEITPDEAKEKLGVAR